MHPRGLWLCCTVSHPVYHLATTPTSTNLCNKMHHSSSHMHPLSLSWAVSLDYSCEGCLSSCACKQDDVETTRFLVPKRDTKIIAIPRHQSHLHQALCLC